MGGRGTFALGISVPYTFETVSYIEDIKVLKGIGNKHGLPEEAHSSHAYIQLKPDGTFHEMRIYDKDHYLTFELAYHPETSLDSSRKPVLHYHIYDRSFHRSSAIKATKPMIKHFKKYLKGIVV